MKTLFGTPEIKMFNTGANLLNNSDDVLPPVPGLGAEDPVE